MDLTIIIVSYNEAEYIERAVESCLRQKFSGTMEIVIGDDGSSDGSIEIVKRLSQEHSIISFFVTENRNDGEIIPAVRASNVIKRALSKARGRYLSILSADDYYCTFDRFEKAISFLDAPSSKRYSATCTDFSRVYGNERQENVISNAPSWRSLLIAKYYFHLSTFIFRREVYEKGLLFDRYCSDVGMFYAICKCGKIKKINEVTFCHFQRNDSISHSIDKFETSVHQMIFLQDVYNKRFFLFSSLCRVFRELRMVFKGRQQLNNSKFQVLADYCSNYNNNFLGWIKKYDSLSFINKIKFKLLYFKAFCSFMGFRGINLFYKVFTHGNK